MSIPRTLPPVLARIHCRQPSNNHHNYTQIWVQRSTFVPVGRTTAAVNITSPRRTLTSSLRRVAHASSTSLHCPFQGQQRRELSFLGTLRAVFQQPTPPKAPKKIPKETRVLGRVRLDEYEWMANKDDPDLRNYIQAENTYAHEYFASEAAAIHLLNREMKQVLRTKRVSAPLTTTVRGYEYYTKTSRYGMVYCRRRKSASAMVKEYYWIRHISRRTATSRRFFCQQDTTFSRS
ncbi:hypothetical protein K457DRAFT_511783 [Linnemannia elongata AG-77]|uniref:Peptidase S9A N-terminal domain-containing protein n=1 Tax=Linnemannia elongata AG-77 TaxID=1314771 RepID=A0A197JYE4_9FUNG|nr:hypothetical protein K457DRAFT_511783 [Linnemannia elongata AG-77]